MSMLERFLEEYLQSKDLEKPKKIQVYSTPYGGLQPYQREQLELINGSVSVSTLTDLDIDLNALKWKKDELRRFRLETLGSIPVASFHNVARGRSPSSVVFDEIQKVTPNVIKNARKLRKRRGD